MASQLSQALGKDITFVDTPETAMRDALFGFGLPQWQTDGLIEDYAHYRRGKASGISNAVQDVTGVTACTFQKFIAEHKQAFLH